MRWGYLLNNIIVHTITTYTKYAIPYLGVAHPDVRAGLQAQHYAVPMVEREVNHLAEHGCGAERSKQTDHSLSPAFEPPQIGVGENEAQRTCGMRRIIIVKTFGGKIDVFSSDLDHICV
jgi:hypothetical protein